MRHEPIIHPKNDAGEHLHNVDIHFTIKDGVATTEIYAIKSTPDTGSGPQEYTGRRLQITTCPTGQARQIDFWRSLSNLSDAVEDHDIPFIWAEAIREDAEYAMSKLDPRCTTVPHPAVRHLMGRCTKRRNHKDVCMLENLKESENK